MRRQPIFLAASAAIGAALGVAAKYQLGFTGYHMGPAEVGTAIGVMIGLIVFNRSKA
jgi:hypothetical protein